MEYEITIAGKSAKVTLARSAGERERYEFRDAASGRSGAIIVIDRSPGRLILSVDNKLYSVSPRASGKGRLDFVLNGEPMTAELSAAKASGTASADPAASPELVVSSFPAKVVRVPVSNGSDVPNGATLIVLEAMKMESYVEAPRSCTVLEVFVKEGEMVARGTKLARLKFP